MKTFAPDYYTKFKCTADKCTQNCCIGWEIDIDADSLEKYKNVSGEFGTCLRKNIDTTTDNAHFILSENDRCPFLNNKNLCTIITNLGEENLCRICADHPRFRNFFSSSEEIGLGLCCEAACELILSHKGDFKLVEIADDGNIEIDDEVDECFFSKRQKLFKIVKDREHSMEERINKMLEMYDVTFPKKSVTDWKKIFFDLERLDDAWDKKIENLGKFSHAVYNDEINNAFENILIYFIYRHMPDGLYDGRMKERLCFVLLGFYVIGSIFRAEKDKTLNTLAEICRMYSAEIEYCEENIDKLLLVMNEQ